jgi:hypothetical protein
MMSYIYCHGFFSIAQPVRLGWQVTFIIMVFFCVVITRFKTIMTNTMLIIMGFLICVACKTRTTNTTHHPSYFFMLQALKPQWWMLHSSWWFFKNCATCKTFFFGFVSSKTRTINVALVILVFFLLLLPTSKTKTSIV